MRECIIVYRAPVSTHKRTHEQQQSGLRLMKISNQLVYHMEGISWFDHYLRGGMKRVLSCLVQVVQYSLQTIVGGQCVGFFLGFKLLHLYLFGLWFLCQLATYKIETFEGTHGSCSHRHYMS